jgi:hypothetical protein
VLIARLAPLALLVAACGGSPAQPDAAVDAVIDAAADSALAGDISCSELTCHTDQLCRPDMNLPDDGGIPAMCLDVPQTCKVVDCMSETCAPCLQELCGCSGPSCFVYIHGREIRC